MSTTTIEALPLVLVGGGMITRDQLLPSLYDLQRQGVVGAMTLCALQARPLRALADDEELTRAFPGQGFRALPALTENLDAAFPDLYRKAIDELPRGSLVVVAVPDNAHYPVIKYALEHDQHVLTVKPLVLKHAESVELEKLAHGRGLYVGIEYHKRFDRRSLEARGNYRKGRFGELKIGEAKLMEPWFYRHSNFQNWFTKENTDPFTYVGCHYVDLVYFITGLRPVEITLQGVEGKFPNGNTGYMWANGRVRFENGALLSVLGGLGYPDEAAGGNDQNLSLFCEGKDGGATITHDDQYRGVIHCYADKKSHPFPFRYINPDYFRLVPWEGEGSRAVGYGYDSVAANVMAVVRLRRETSGLAPDRALLRRQQILDEIDERGLLATPKNSAINELVIEAGRLSIQNDGRHVQIDYDPTPRVRLR